MVAASRRFFSGLATPSTGVMSPTSSSAMSWMRHIFMHLGRSRRGASDGGANMEMRDMRYMWSAMDSPLKILPSAQLKLQYPDRILGRVATIV